MTDQSVGHHHAGHNPLARAAMAAPLLERSEEQQLAIRWLKSGDKAALHTLIRSHMRLVGAIARRFRNYGLPMADLVQEGHVGLLEAAARFEPDREVRFSTYASWWIRAAIQDYVLRNWSIVRGGTSSGQKALFFNLRRIRARLERAGGAPAEGGHQEVLRSIATSLGVNLEDVARMDARLAGHDISLNMPVGQDENGASERIDQLVADDPLPDEAASLRIDGERRRRWLAAALRDLNEREIRIIRARRLTEEGATLEALGARMGISKERVRQIENRAIEKLRLALAQHVGAPLNAFA
ncbi:RNA polymerase factor sigma-32 [Ancylobacter sp. 6x-1]|uniref:RNA polymerase factor sigma-32 n=1 Tax=Ancylobacter crimeensis TaxID=2579147 RepID=A0ABT0DDP7_9HYPH|nr:RNA polymerase factor sigma-32 [Ancylobacter crimeensis]MCK0198090.1 RNA polymerase factor sigma-32 [Ancylobacter crimeensis]